MTLVLTKISETQTKITLGWTPVSGAIGYRFQSASSAPKWSHTWDATKNQVTFGKAAWYKVEALGVKDAGQYPSANPEPPSSLPLQPPAWGAPMTISAGGTYTGLSPSSSGSTPALTIATDQPVVITDSWFRNLTGGPIIQGSVNFQLRHFTIKRSRIYGGTSWWLDVEGTDYLEVSNCSIDKTAGINVYPQRVGATILITRNQQRNVQGPLTGANYLSAFFKARIATGGPVTISWNEIINEYNVSQPEDVISIYHSSDCLVENNYIQHQSMPGNAYNTSSQGSITLDTYGAPNGCHRNIIRNNQVVDAYGIVCIVYAGSSASGNLFENNRIVADRLLPNGQNKGNGWGSPLVITEGSVDCHAHGNYVSYIDRDGNQPTTPYGGSFPTFAHQALRGAAEGPAAEAANNTFVPDPDASDETAEWNLWQQKLTTASVKVGA